MNEVYPVYRGTKAIMQFMGWPGWTVTMDPGSMASGGSTSGRFSKTVFLLPALPHWSHTRLEPVFKEQPQSRLEITQTEALWLGLVFFFLSELEGGKRSLIFKHGS